MNVFFHSFFSFPHHYGEFIIFYFLLRKGKKPITTYHVVILVRLLFTVVNDQHQISKRRNQVKRYTFCLWKLKAENKAIFMVVHKVGEWLSISQGNIAWSFINDCQGKFTVIKTLDEKLKICLFFWLIDKWIVDISDFFIAFFSRILAFFLGCCINDDIWSIDNYLKSLIALSFLR